MVQELARWLEAVQISELPRTPTPIRQITKSKLDQDFPSLPTHLAASLVQEDAVFCPII